MMTDRDIGTDEETTIVDITLEPNGKESAFFSVVGEDFTCGFDVRYGGITGGEGTDELTFYRSYMGTFGIIKK